jgi:hypothetical protein
MVSKRVHFFYMLTWINSLLLVAAFAALVWTLLKTPAQVQQVPSLTLGVYTIIHTHHLMGSAYAIGRVLRELNEQKFDSRVRLRDGDFFMEIGDEINRVAETLAGGAGTAAVAEAPKAEEPKAEEPKAEEPKAEEPKAEAETATENKEDTTTEASAEATPSEAS